MKIQKSELPFLMAVNLLFELNHYRNVKGSFDKEDNIRITENSLNEEEKAFYMENEEMIEKVLKQLQKIHKSVYKS